MEILLAVTAGTAVIFGFAWSGERERARRYRSAWLSGRQTLRAIAERGRNSSSGTARMLARWADEALGGEVNRD